jgi:hypothetical protein
MSVAAVILAGALGAAVPQTARPAQPPKSNLVTVEGCVAAAPNDRRMFTIDDDGQTYILKGVDARELVGRLVRVTGLPPKRLRIVGGLYPSPNVAAQAGSMDPSKAAIAAQSGPTSQSSRPPIEITVKSVRFLAGSCEQTGR